MMDERQATEIRRLKQVYAAAITVSKEQRQRAQKAEAEVQRLRKEQREFEKEASSTAGALDERAEKAEAALVVHAKEWTEATELWMKQVKELEAERDRYKRVVEAIRDDVNGDDCLFNKDRALTMEGLL